MWIKSQDGTRLVEVKKCIETIKDTPLNLEIDPRIFVNGLQVGQYKPTERAKQVLREIENALIEERLIFYMPEE